MSDNIKLVIEIPEEIADDIKETYKGNDVLYCAVKYGTPLDTVKAKIEKSYNNLDKYYPFALCTFKNIVREILDNIGKAESEDKG